ncbi:MAG: acylneuraminate cytidylyltransferase family protein [Candidatus Hodarchaeales archaeon]|jgi:N-acylneuraminate cytidylyltransferase
MKSIALIPARGGSKEIPKKNIIDLNGFPLIYYTIKSALESNVDEVWVSTDSEEISCISKKYGAQVITRPDELCGDVIMPDEALVHFAQQKKFDFLVFIQPTSPLLTPFYINQGLEKMSEYDSVFGGYREHWAPEWSLENKTINWNIKHRPRRQDKKEVIIENGSFYITRRELLLESRLRYSGNIGAIEMPKSMSFQIDSYDDLEIVRRML